MKKTVLIVDDSAYMRKLISDTLSQGGFTIIAQAGTGEQAIDMAMELHPDIITLDNLLPDMSGVDVLHALRSQDLHAKIIMVSAVGHQSIIQDEIEMGAAAYLVKPFKPNDLIEIVNGVIGLSPKKPNKD